MHTSVKVVADTICQGKRLTSLLVRHPWVVHAEFLRHRILSPSVASSRAIPLKDQIESVMKEPYTPYKYGAAQKGMFATEEVPEERQAQAREIWLKQRDAAVAAALEFEKLGIHKEVGAQMLKPYGYVNALWTGTEWENFLNLRTPIQAREEMRVMARAVRTAMTESKPTPYHLHLPFIRPQDHTGIEERSGVLYRHLGLGTLPDQLPLYRKELKLNQGWIALAFASASRCARLSYNKTDGGKATLSEDLLKGVQHMLDGHSSVLEHQGVVFAQDLPQPPSSNFGTPWSQFRKIFANEAVYRGQA